LIHIRQRRCLPCKSRYDAEPCPPLSGLLIYSPARAEVIYVRPDDGPPKAEYLAQRGHSRSSFGESRNRHREDSKWLAADASSVSTGLRPVARRNRGRGSQGRLRRRDVASGGAMKPETFSTLLKFARGSTKDAGLQPTTLRLRFSTTPTIS
jgi:hypothetical protein